MLRSWQELRRARWAGRRDGKAGIPAPDDHAIPFALREITSRAEEQVHAAIERWRREDGALAAQLADLEPGIGEAAARVAASEQRLETETADHERYVAEEDARLARLAVSLEELPGAEAPEVRFEQPGSEDVEDPETEPGSSSSALAQIGGGSAAMAPVTSAQTRAVSAIEDPSWHGIGPILYRTVVGLILVGEFPLNSVAFRLFGESDLFTYVMTVSLAVALVAMAHAAGTLLARGMTRTADRALVGACTLVPVGAIGAISLVRHGYLVEVGGGSVMGPVLGTLGFALINLLVFGAAVGWSYLRHDPTTLVNLRAAQREREREQERAERRASEREARLRARRREAEAERRRRALEAASERHRAELEARRQEAMLRREQIFEAMRTIRDERREREQALAGFERAVEEAHAALAELEQRADRIGGERQALHAATSARLREIRAHRDRLVFAYCSANVRARKDRTAPPALERVPALPMPDGFEEVD